MLGMLIAVLSLVTHLSFVCFNVALKVTEIGRITGSVVMHVSDQRFKMARCYQLTLEQKNGLG